MHLAEVNISLPVSPLTTPQLSEFVAALEPVNALADAAPGFVWRLQTEDGDATAIRVLDDHRLIVNLTVWTSLETLGAFVFHGAHRTVMARRREWFVPMQEAMTVLWWVPEGVLPTVADAEQRLAHLRAHGPSAHAFTFRRPFPAPAGPVVQAEDGWFCPA